MLNKHLSLCERFQIEKGLNGKILNEPQEVLYGKGYCRKLNIKQIIFYI